MSDLRILHYIKNKKELFTTTFIDFNFTLFKYYNNIDSNDSNIHIYQNMLENNTNIVYSLKTFYIIHPEFDYYTYRELNLDKFMNMTEVDVILYWINDNKPEIIKNDIYKKKNIIIYQHRNFSLNDGGITVQYYLAQLLDKYGIKVRIHQGKHNIVQNNLFNNYYNNDFDLNDSIVIYCEGIIGNPLNAPFVVRWMLSELGKNVPYNYVDTWGKNELVYYFNSELKIQNNIDKLDDIYKFLTIIYINPDIKQINNNPRSEFCHTYRKSFYHKNINILHPKNSFEITRYHTQNDYIEIFNKYKYFVCYDPLTFLCIIAPLCGCISIVYPLNGISKKEWLQTTGLNEYLKYKNDYNIYGIAYGNSQEEINYANNSLHLVKDQWDDIKSFEINYITKFITDINQFELMQNTIKNNYFVS
jgi:hypothetical protein